MTTVAQTAQKIIISGFAVVLMALGIGFTAVGQPASAAQPVALSADDGEEPPFQCPFC